MKERIIALVATLSLLLALVGVMAIQPSGNHVQAQDAGTFYRTARLANANVVSADETSGNFVGWAQADLIAFEVTCVEDSGTATLDIALQRSVDGGTVWTSIVAMTQLAATGSEVKLYADLRAASAQMIGDRLRVNYDVTGTGQYTCSVYLVGEN